MTSPLTIDEAELGSTVLPSGEPAGASTDVTIEIDPLGVAAPRKPGWRVSLPEAMLYRIVASASQALQVERCSLALFNPASRELVTVAAVPTPQPDFRRSRFSVGEGAAGEVARTAQALLINDTEHDGRFKLLGRRIPVRSLICAPLLDDTSVLGTITAVSQQPHAFTAHQLELLTIFADQAALAIAQSRRAAEIELLKSAFLSTISHELKTPLNSIHGFVALLLSGRTGTLSPLQQDFLESVQHSAKQLHRLVEDIMQVSLAETNQLRLAYALTDIQKLVGHVARQFEPEFDRLGIRLDLEIDDSLQPITCDALRIEQVLSNLLNNAAKFTPSGGRVTVGAHCDSSGIRLTVHDTGTGIPEAEQAKIFDCFYQVQHGLNRSHGGAGLGLTIVKHLVERHGGRIGVTSTVGEGSIFAVWLPVSPAPSPMLGTGA